MRQKRILGTFFSFDSLRLLRGNPFFGSVIVSGGGRTEEWKHRLDRYFRRLGVNAGLGLGRCLPRDLGYLAACKSRRAESCSADLFSPSLRPTCRTFAPFDPFQIPLVVSVQAPQYTSPGQQEKEHRGSPKQQRQQHSPEALSGIELRLKKRLEYG